LDSPKILLLAIDAADWDIENRRLGDETRSTGYPDGLSGRDGQANEEALRALGYIS